MFKRRGFTDRLYWINFRCVWAFTIACFLLNVASLFVSASDLPIITYGLPLAWAELGVHTHLVINKAERENRRKFGYKENGCTESEEEL